MRTRKIFTSRNAFEGSTVDTSNPAQVLAEKMAAFCEKLLTDCRRDSARLDALESKFRDPSTQARLGIKAGLKSGQGTEEEMARDNQRLQKRLSNPVYASAFFLSQRTAHMARKRLSAGLPQRHLA